MTPSAVSRPCRPLRRLGSAGAALIAVAGSTLAARALLGSALVLGALPVSVVLAAPPACAATLPYPEAVERSGTAARAVLARAGRESCLRGKLTNALLSLSTSCEREARRDPLCALADRAVVVTPMTLAFMDDTSRELLRLLAPGAPAPAAPGRPEPDPASGESP